MITPTKEMRDYLVENTEELKFWYMNIDSLEVLFNWFVNEFWFETWYDLVWDIDCYLYCTAYIRNLYNWHNYNVILDVSCKTYFENVDDILDYLISKENFARQMQEHFNS